ncbi:PREDICTED: uncharacterized protein LOC104820187 [Tarenaya hassleriana]|uniref:uncharacterized protein LOC104820187 n=1 Tax=Tarenaya hassleriana TaxID=28532 RepID=UPI0008FD623E|nr:PREDICTED: uncharacterized protein LOC104820187 [Tarenaya hassleriana]
MDERIMGTTAGHQDARHTEEDVTIRLVRKEDRGEISLTLPTTGGTPAVQVGDFSLPWRFLLRFLLAISFSLQMASSSSSSSAPSYEDIQVSFVYDFNDIHHAPKITTKCYPFQTIRSLKKALTDEEWAYFNKESQFRHIFHLQCEDTLKMVPVSVLLHRALKLEGNVKELWFVLNGVPVRYSITEHAIISGLNCEKYPKDWAERRGHVFRMKIFGPSKVTISGALEKLHNTSTTDVEDRKRLAILILLGGVVDHGIKGNDVIPNALVDMVENLEFCEEFPWGRYTFDKIVDQILKMYASDPEPKNRWHCPGFVIPLMLLPFECVESLGANGWYMDVEDVDPSCPRMCKKRIQPGLFVTHSNVMKRIGVTSRGIRSILQTEGEEVHILFNLHEDESNHPLNITHQQDVCMSNLSEEKGISRPWHL